MQKPGKKPRSREAFAAVFEEQTRRFSAFELLGLSSEPSPSSPAPQPSGEVSDWLADTVQSPESLRQAEGTGRQAEGLRADPQGEAFVIDRRGQEQRPDSLVQDQTLDPQQGQTLDGQSLGQTVRPRLGQTRGNERAKELRPNRKAQALGPLPSAIVLAPLQWAVWETLQDIEAMGHITSYRQIAKRTESTPDGVRKAIRVLQKEGAILRKEIIRTAEEQGFRVALRYDLPFRKGTLNEAKAILKRGLSLEQTPDRQGHVSGPDGLRMFVCRNTNIRQTDIAQLLRIPLPEWKIREQTLVQIGDALPEMTAIEFRLSLAYLVEQAKQAKEEIRNPNAWIKAAFEKNGGPLVTEREIEVRYGQGITRREAQAPSKNEEGGSEEIELLRWYLTAGSAARAKIDRRADQQAARLLKIVAEDKRAGVIEQARLEAIRTYRVESS